MNFLAQKRKNIFIDNTTSVPSKTEPFNRYYYRELAKLTASGGWRINFVEKKSYIDPEARRILNTPKDFKPSLRNAMEFYAPEHRDLAAKTFYDCSNGNSFSVVIKMLTFDKKPFWAKAMGAPIYSKKGETTKMRHL